MRAKAKILVVAMVVGSLWALTSVAKAADAPDFLVKGVSARPAAMGGAYVAVSDKADSVYWNPAGLALLEIGNAQAVHSNQNDFDITTDMITFGMPVVDKKWGFGAGLFYSSIGGIEYVPAAARPVVLNTFDETELGLLVGFGYKVREDISVGASLKYMNLKFMGFNGSGYGLDIAGLYMPTKNISLGINLQNFLSNDLGSDNLPFNAKLGGAFTTNDKKFKVAADIDTNVNDDAVFHIGAEYMVIPQLAVRLGANDGDITAGIGLKEINGGWSFDYAYNDSSIGDTHRISVGYDFLKK